MLSHFIFHMSVNKHVRCINCLCVFNCSYYRRFRLYKYAFTEKVVRQYTQVMPQEVEIPCVSPPLGLAIAIQSRVRVVEEDGEQNDNEFEDEEE